MASPIQLTLTRRDGSAVHLEAPLHDILRAVRESGGVGVFELEADGAETLVIVQKVEKERDEIRAMAVREVRPEDHIRVEVELAALNLPEPVLKKQAEAVRLAKRIKVRARIKDLPKRIVVDLSQMDVQETLCAGDIDLPKGVELVSPKDEALFTVRGTGRV